MRMRQERVVVTGMGVLAANAQDTEAFARALRDGVSGVKPVTKFDVSDFAYGEAAQIDEAFLDPKSRMDEASQMAVIAARQAWGGAGAEGAFDRRRVGVCIGTTMGAVLSLEKIHRAQRGSSDELDPAGFDEIRFDSVSRNVARVLRLLGPQSTVTIACASGAHAIGYGADLVRQGAVDATVAGGVDTLSRFVFCGFNAVRAITRSKNRPFDRDRDGLVLGEGAGMVFLESLTSARRRGADIYAEVLGCGFTNDGVHPTAPDPQGGGLSRSIRFALDGTGVEPRDIDYISAHGTGTVLNDRMEARAIARIFGEEARHVPVSSIKPMIGHTLGAAGSIESVAAILSMRHGFIPANLNLETPEPEGALQIADRTLAGQNICTVLKLSAGFSGNNAALVFRKYLGD